MNCELARWHEVECWSYNADLAIWRGLSELYRGRVLDVGAGTGRVALDLKRNGFEVTALDYEPELLAALKNHMRAEALEIPTIKADISVSTELPHRFELIIVPMQTLQLLDLQSLSSCFENFANWLTPDGCVAVAIATEMYEFGADTPGLPEPDWGEWERAHYSSQTIGLSHVGARGYRIDRTRVKTTANGEVECSDSVLHLLDINVDDIEALAARCDLKLEQVLTIAPTDDHVGSEVVILRG